MKGALSLKKLKVMRRQLILRIDKFFSELGLRSRSEIKKDIKLKYVTVNNEVVLKNDMIIDENKDVVKYKGETIIYENNVYYMLNKPQGVLTARKDNIDKTVIDLIYDKRKNLSPVGRLDKDTEGLLLVTDDGKLSHQLMSPKKHVAKTYFAVVRGKVDLNDVEIFKTGLDIGDKKITLPAFLKIKSNYIKDEEEFSEIELTITEGRYHQVKRMFEKVEKKVIFLKRTAIGDVLLDKNLRPGEYRKLTNNELNLLRNYDIIKK